MRGGIVPQPDYILGDITGRGINPVMMALDPINGGGGSGSKIAGGAPTGAGISTSPSTSFTYAAKWFYSNTCYYEVVRSD